MGHIHQFKLALLSKLVYKLQWVMMVTESGWMLFRVPTTQLTIMWGIWEKILAAIYDGMTTNAYTDMQSLDRAWRHGHAMHCIHKSCQSFYA